MTLQRLCLCHLELIRFTVGSMVQWISRDELAEKYDLNRGAIDVFVHKKILPAKHVKNNMINETYLLKVREFKRKMQLRNQDLYYLICEHFSTYQLAKACHIGYVELDSLIRYFRDTLFRIDNTTILDIRISKRALVAYRYWWKIERRLRRRGASIAKILDNRMANA